MNDNAAVLKFFDRYDHLDYNQVEVSHITGLGLQDLNAWRKRGFIFADTSQSRKVIFTGRLLMRAQFVGEMAWIVGPKRAGEMFDDLDHTINGYADSLRNSKTDLGAVCSEILKDRVVVGRPVGSYETAKLQRLSLPTSEGVRDHAAGFPWYLTSGDAYDIHPLAHAHTILPLGQIVLDTAVRAQMMK